MQALEHPAIPYTKAIYEPGDRVCIQLIHATEEWAPGKAKTQEYFQSIEETAMPDSIALLQQKQREGWHVFICMSPFKPEAGKRPAEMGNRVEELISEIRNVYCEIDERGEERLAEIETAASFDDQIPIPHFVLQSSPGKYQIVWRVQDFTLAQQRALNESLVKRFGGDPASVDGVRVLRLPGFFNLKPKYQEGGNPAPLVRIISQNDGSKRRYQPSDFKLRFDAAKQESLAQAAAIPPEKLNRIIELLTNNLAEAGITHSRLLKDGTSFKYQLDECPWGRPDPKDPERGHRNGNPGDAAVFIGADGKLGFHCLHTWCAEHYHWPEFRAELERLAGKKLVFADEAPVTVLINGQEAGKGVTKSAGPQLLTDTTKAAANNPGDWRGLPEPLGDKLSPVLPFDEAFLPDAIRPWVKDVAERMVVPLDFAAVCAIVTTAGVIGRRAFVFPKKLDKEWKESICLSGAVVAISGATKTPVWKQFINVVVENEMEWRHEHNKKMALYREGVKKWKADKREAERRHKDQQSAFKFTTPPPLEPPPCRCNLLNDATPEAMHQVMMDNPEGLLYYRDELSGWVAELSKKEREVQRGMFLAAMNGNDPYSIDRIGRGHIFAIMCASVFGSFQPEIFKDFLSNTTNIDDGTIPRFAFLIWPDPVKPGYLDRPIDESAKAKFREIVRKLAAIRADTIWMHFTDDAQAVFEQWLSELNQKLCVEQQPEKLSHLQKYRGALPKIAALLQLVDLAALPGEIQGNHLIDRSHLDKAIGLLRYLETHMHRVYACIKSPLEIAEHVIAEHLKAGHLKDTFTIREIVRKCWKGLKDRYVISDALQTLEEKRWVRSYKLNQGEGHRETYVWIAHPRLQQQTKRAA